MSDDEQAHGPLPLGETDPTAMHTTVDALAAALHAYVDQAVGVRAEFGSSEADEDPRVLAAEAHIGTLNAQLFDSLHSVLGIHPELTALVWESEDGDVDAPPVAAFAEAFYLGFVVTQQPGVRDTSFDSAMDLLDDAGTHVVERLTGAGLDVVEWASSRGEAAGFGGHDDPEENT